MFQMQESFAKLRGRQDQIFDLSLLLGFSLMVRLAIAALITGPGYPDAAYYFDIASNLVRGHGFTEDFIISYLTPAPSVIHPSNLFWMPLTSMVIAPFLAVFGISWRAAQIPMVLLSATLPLLAYGIAWDIFGSRRYAWVAGFFTLLGGSLYALYFVVTDSFALYSWVSLLAFVGMYQGWRGHPWRFALAGIAIGLAHLTRADGGLLLGVGLLVWLCSQKKSYRGDQSSWTAYDPTQLRSLPWQALLGMIGCYLLTMAPWFLRNLVLIGSPLPLGATTTIWLKSFSDSFSFHKVITAQTYVAWGWDNILSSKLHALGENFVLLSSAFYIPIPFALLGMWIERKRAELVPFFIYFILLYSILSTVFTFPSTTGMFFHSLAALIPIFHLWSLIGMDATIAYASWRFGKAAKQASRMTLESSGKRLRGIFQTSAEGRPRFVLTIPPQRGDLLCLAIVMLAAVFIVAETVFTMHTNWDDQDVFYQQVGQIVAGDYRTHVADHASRRQPIVMVAEAANYFYATGQQAVLLPTQGLPTILQVARSYAVSYLLLTPNQGVEERKLGQGTLADPQLKLVWAGPWGKLYRFVFGP